MNGKPKKRVHGKIISNICKRIRKYKDATRSTDNNTNIHNETLTQTSGRNCLIRNKRSNRTQ